jgi:hypothetical protein
MKPTEIIRRDSVIVEGTPSFFIADKNFEFSGLPILKDSLVYCDGKRIKVNSVRFGIFQDSKGFDYVLEHPAQENGDYIFEKVSSCSRELNILPSGDLGLWHKDHFDIQDNDYSAILPRINSSEKLNFGGVEFSSIMYEYDIENNCLVHFINTKAMQLIQNGNKIDIPEFFEIGYSQVGYTIIEICNKLVHQNIKFGGCLTLASNGEFYGDCAESFDVELEGRKDYVLTISEGSNITFSASGIPSIKLYNEDKFVIESHNFRLL